MFSKNFNPLIRNMLQIPQMSVKRYSNDVSCIFRQNFSSHIEEKLNVQIGQELYASHSYLAMSNFFARTEISLTGTASFFLAMSNEERDHALQLINYQNMRGGRVVMQNILKPKDEFTSLLMAFEQALLIERNNTTALMELVGVAEGEHDVVTADFIVSKFLNEQVSRPFIFPALDWNFICFH